MDSQDDEEFRRFVAGRSLALLRTAYALCGDRDVAEDLVQGALAKLYRRWHKIDEPEGYVRRIIYNDQASRWRRRLVLREDPVDAVPDRAAPDAVEAVGDRMDVLALLQRLAPRQRAVLVLRYYEDLSEREIAALLGCSTGTVRSQAHRALAKLRDLALEPTLDGA
ncbi:SigE family RNA polymerase sigma factor [Jiangella alkaliphila]|uniref:RNA polymerase sigma-70 factor, sigma-E family n=1 Tax=Jiangella alkaliphila TaxID=419479 RepID=A0A1H2KGF7_9ACTN|nr:SigE family RNA polymerase sigma factor [Jiangella alkaliphila]SDU67498.1 RNA polymerase sigma-70 factor, sigma-E family [Jiangella alkaliphila]